jgi:hypothetical protein
MAGSRTTDAPRARRRCLRPTPDASVGYGIERFVEGGAVQIRPGIARSGVVRCAGRTRDGTKATLTTNATIAKHAAATNAAW